jgi:hypothetical protein
MKCGTHSAYSHGCRCDACKAAHREYTRARRAKALADGTLSHGVRGTYSAGCRCWKCVEARRVVYFTKPGEYGYQRLSGGVS